MEPGLQLDRMTNEVAVADVLVKADGERAAGVFGRAVLVHREGREIFAPPTNAIARIGKPAGSDWCVFSFAENAARGNVVELLGNEAIDALERGRAARPPGPSTPVSTASRLSRDLDVQSIALWATSTAFFIRGGAVIDAGVITQAWSFGRPDDIRRTIDDHRHSQDIWDGDNEPANIWTLTVIAAVHSEIKTGVVTDFLDAELKERGACQPAQPVWKSVADGTGEYESVWVSVPQ